MPDSITLKLTEHEHSLIIDLLKEGIPGLQEEIRHTDTWQYREELREKKNASLALLAKLRHQHALQQT